MIIDNLYSHFKGNYYKLIEIATHTETQEKFVIYESVTDNKVWARPYDNFFGTVIVNGKEIPRFKHITVPKSIKF